jgi:hypothetical protein
MTDSARLASLRTKLKARQGKKEYEENCEHLRAQIAKLENAERDYGL